MHPEDILPGGALDQDPEEEFREYIGRRLGDYELTGILGIGGVGAVFRARHQLVGREVAIKILRREHCSNRVLVERFLFEAKAANDIKHENIVQVFDFKEDSELGPYLVMELLEGGISLEDEIQRKGPLPEERAIHIALQITRVLRAAHDKGIVHRDLKPENIFLTEALGQKDIVKVLDFGVAKLLSLEGSSPQRTEAGALIGTLQYMSPEQCRGIGVDHRTDIYALGAVLYEMVTGKPAFDGNVFGDVFAKQLIEPPPNPRHLAPHISTRLEKVILRCLTKDKEKRYADATELAVALGADPKTLTLVGNTRLPANLESKPPKSGFWKKPYSLWAIFFTMVILGGAAVYGVFALFPEAPESLIGALEPSPPAEAPKVTLPEPRVFPVEEEPTSLTFPMPLLEPASGPSQKEEPESLASLPTSEPVSEPTSEPAEAPIGKTTGETTGSTPEEPGTKNGKKPQNKKKKFEIPLDERPRR